MTIVISGSPAGADMMTLRAPAARCLEAPSRSRNNPVHSATISTPRSPQPIFSGSRMERMAIDLPSTSRRSSWAVRFASHMPCTESYLRRWAMVAASARSLIATTSTAELFQAARKTRRPILPNPLIPILTVICSPLAFFSLPMRLRWIPDSSWVGYQLS